VAEATTAAELDEQLASEVERMAAPARANGPTEKAADPSRSRPEAVDAQPPPASPAASDDSDGSFEEVAPEEVAASLDPAGGGDHTSEGNRAGTPVEPAPAESRATGAPATAAVATTLAPTTSPNPGLALAASEAMASAVGADESPFIRFFRALLEIISLPLTLVPESKRRAVNWIALSLAAWAPIAWLLLLFVFK
jgi:hypothetical protein